jgi:hypothetical protein
MFEEQLIQLFQGNLIIDANNQMKFDANNNQMDLDADDMIFDADDEYEMEYEDDYD